MLSALLAFVARVRASTWVYFLVKGFGILCVLGFLVWLGNGRRLPGPFVAAERAPPSEEASVVVEAGTSPIATSSIADARALESNAVATANIAVVASAPATTARGRATPEDPVYLNEASVDDLRRLPGVGAKRAEAIVAHRRHIGRFARVEDLLRVKGVGRGTIKKWRPLVRFEIRDAGAS